MLGQLLIQHLGIAATDGVANLSKRQNPHIRSFALKDFGIGSKANSRYVAHLFLRLVAFFSQPLKLINVQSKRQIGYHTVKSKDTLRKGKDNIRTIVLN